MTLFRRGGNPSFTAAFTWGPLKAVQEVPPLAKVLLAEVSSRCSIREL